MASGHPYNRKNKQIIKYNYVTNRKVAGSRPDEVNDFYRVT
jgi:hypothetical protein